MPPPGLEVSVGKLQTKPNQTKHRNAQLGQSRAELKSLSHPQGESITPRILPGFSSCSSKAASPCHCNDPTQKQPCLSYLYGISMKEYKIYSFKRPRFLRGGSGTWKEMSASSGWGFCKINTLVQTGVTCVSPQLPGTPSSSSC